MKLFLQELMQGYLSIKKAENQSFFCFSFSVFSLSKVKMQSNEYFDQNSAQLRFNDMKRIDHSLLKRSYLISGAIFISTIALIMYAAKGYLSLALLQTI
jgi:hypothetical protein